ncbi:HD domain-containing phosphohydrolase [Bacillus sp. ISL-45]|uniref:HD domain-containing phosphohydrolase n=1 Tax=Bacillus sp. ISL-45 TaxID=2819128 RepID=UPI001BE73BF7|nr:HD domain-containing phosphohydrolase [Bacillus sp. ISL-45]MBT2663869.1 HD domain-containing protein [Bacillus sp. ISL-45]
MKVINWYTISLILIGCISFIFSLSHLDFSMAKILILMTCIVIVLEIFPVKLPSGDTYAAGSIGYLFLLINGGFSYAVLAIFIATGTYYLISLRKIRIPVIRLLVTIGMYVTSMLAASISWEFAQNANVFLGVGMVAIVFELVNFFLLEGIEATVFRKKMFNNILQKLTELIIPILISILVISRLALVESEPELMISILYTFFFLLFLIYFSHEFTYQFFLRKSTSNAFMKILEDSINPHFAGHGNRVGMICDLILEDIGYPKRKRNNLVQIASIHDIGKSLLPSYIFRKRGDLTLSEEREYKSHSEKAVEIVKAMFSNESFPKWVLHHHERWDGKGFPSGLKGAEIPLESRIIALANELDHILTRHKDPETILKLLEERSGTLLDPILVGKIKSFHIEAIIGNMNFPLANDELQHAAELTEAQYSQNETYSNIGESFFIQVKGGKVYSPKSIFSNSLFQSLADSAIERQELVHDTFMHENITLDLHAQQLQNGDVTIFAHDLTPYLHFRKQLESSILESYADIINKLSEEKIRLHTSRETLLNHLGDKLAEVEITKNSDVPKSRGIIKSILEQYAPHLDSMKVQVAVTEAVTNVLKHAIGGKLSITIKDNRMQFFISDKGSGIPLHEIPKTILVSGYSSKKSLGQGFKMIAKFCDEVQIQTSSNGTFVLIEYNLR